MGLVVVSLVVGFFGYSKSSGLRTVSRVVSFSLFAIFGVVAALSLYGSFALSGKGGGTLIFLAIPSAFLAWLFFNSFSSSLSHEPYFDLNVGQKIGHNQTLIDSQILAHETTIAENSKKLESFWLTPAKRKRLRDDVSHAQFMMKGLAAMRDKVADPAIYKGDEV